MLGSGRSGSWPKGNPKGKRRLTVDTSSFNKNQEKQYKEITKDVEDSVEYAKEVTDYQDELKVEYEGKLASTIENIKKTARGVQKELEKNKEKIQKECDEGNTDKCRKKTLQTNKKTQEKVVKGEKEVHDLINDYLESYSKKLREARDWNDEKIKKIEKKRDEIVDTMTSDKFTDEFTEYSDLDALFYDDINTIDDQIAACYAINEEIDALLLTVERIMYGYVCFDLIGADTTITPGSDEDKQFVNATEKALTLAFAEEGMDVDMQEVSIVKQQVVSGSNSQRRGLRSSHRQLGIRNNLVAEASWICECGIDGLDSDVFARRGLGEMNEFDRIDLVRELWTDDIVQGFSDKVVAFMDELMPNLLEVIPVPCRDFIADLP
eukprot:CAMPEP_0118696844 /NCGR_PEP_ID=MMETSP0800-20121206/14110_1 /TAXON_ID=210618 ORGANISM="Striatella unipunctata, Strain CCMP2910" /NCGR_SAMPLE_ID=MMETSP0800 /ASSEMBLY_ACC=CAM_ASM_000638 /LENGTH=378 /DNA_ID=CAMNT_0006596077 /DNA_START=92 /DNA_END=1228 /DNA_ORIENTATION=+